MFVGLETQYSDHFSPSDAEEAPAEVSFGLSFWQFVTLRFNIPDQIPAEIWSF